MTVMSRYVGVILLALLASGAVYMALGGRDSRVKDEQVSAPLAEQKPEMGVGDSQIGESLRRPVPLSANVEPVSESEPQPGERDIGAVSASPGGEQLQLALVLLDEMHAVETTGGFENLSRAKLDELADRIADVKGARCQEIFTTRHELGLYETRRVVQPEPSMRDLEKEYGCMLGTQSGQPDQDGTYRLDIVLYPQGEYPEIYRLDQYWQQVVRLSHEKRTGQE
jgi:hypothetical protein